MFLGEIYAKFTHRIQQYVKRIQTYGQVCFIPIKKWMKDASLESQADEKLVPGRRFSLLSHQGAYYNHNKVPHTPVGKARIKHMARMQGDWSHTLPWGWKWCSCSGKQQFL